MFVIFNEWKETRDKKTEGQVKHMKIVIQQSLIDVTEVMGVQISFSQNFFELSKR